MSSAARGQAHRHGVTKNLVEGIGGLLTGAALVLFLRGLVKGRSAASAQPLPEASKTQTDTGDTA